VNLRVTEEKKRGEGSMDGLRLNHLFFLKLILRPNGVESKTRLTFERRIKIVFGSGE